MRQKRIVVRVDESEHADAMRAAKKRKLTLSEWIRDVVRSTLGSKSKCR